LHSLRAVTRSGESNCRPGREYRRKPHTSSREVADIAKKAPPGPLILSPRANPGGIGRPNPEHVLLQEVRQLCSGKVVIGHDLDGF
jgi:ribonuclease BN (tRNA processing enzyme)